MMRPREEPKAQRTHRESSPFHLTWILPPRRLPKSVHFSMATSVHFSVAIDNLSHHAPTARPRRRRGGSGARVYDLLHGTGSTCPTHDDVVRLK